MVEIGRLWEIGDITVAQEHLASSLVSRVMASLYPRILVAQHTLGKAVVTTSPNEYHELGARMVADVLETDGWDAYFLGANTPRKDLVQMLLDRRPELLLISVAMFFNLVRAQEIVEAVRAREELRDIRIMIGGRALLHDPGLWRRLGADGWGADAVQAAALAKSWWEQDSAG
jgi:methanogenic corrinoid protein MtbC1